MLGADRFLNWVWIEIDRVRFGLRLKNLSCREAVFFVSGASRTESLRTASRLTGSFTIARSGT
jgi:hypothetical protein